MELEDNEIGDVIEGEDRVEMHGPFFNWKGRRTLILKSLDYE